MPIPDRLRFDSVDPAYRLLLTDDGSWTLESVATLDTFHSACGARSECQVVYLDNSGLAERIIAQQASTVLELGFGTGTAFILSAALAQKHHVRLQYHAIEANPLSTELLRQVLCDERQWGSDAADCIPLAQTLVEQLDRLETSGNMIQLGIGTTELYLWLTDARTWNSLDGQQFDVVYFDPFSPASAPELWEESFLRRIAERLKPGGSLVSYCVNSAVRRKLDAVGLIVQRVPGPEGGKREVLRAAWP